MGRKKKSEIIETTQATIDPAEALDRAGVLAGFVTDDGRRWQPQFRGMGIGPTRSWDVIVGSVGGPHPVAIEIGDCEVEYAVEIINKFKSDSEFRNQHLPPPKQIEFGTYKDKDTYVTYKAKTYRLLWAGRTKFGDRAKLSFVDVIKEFWVDLSTVVLTQAPPSSVPLERCHRCGRLVSIDDDCYCDD